MGITPTVRSAVPALVITEAPTAAADSRGSGGDLMADQASSREMEYGERWDTFCAIPRGVRSILDVGCGSGLGFQTFRHQGVRVVGVDSFPDCIDAAVGRLDEAL